MRFSLHRGDTAPDERLELRAGNLRLRFDPASLTAESFEIGGVDVLRACYPALRDARWATLPARVRWLERRIGARSFDLRLVATHGGARPSFEWRLALRGAADGSRFTYAATGRALRDLVANRAGFCVLHGAAYAGKACLVEHADGDRRRGRFPAAISPHQPFLAVRALTHRPRPGLAVTVRLEGDTFEMEDQRNWTDASFKTYCRPLALPRPFALRAGDTITQSVELRLSGSPKARSHRPRRETTLRLAARAHRPIALGLAHPPGPPLGPAARRELAASWLDHLHLTLDPSERTCLARWREAVANVRRTGPAGGLAVTLLIRDDDVALREFARELAAGPTTPQVRWLIVDAATRLTAPAAFAAVRALWERHGLRGPLGGGTAAGFVDLNRGRPFAPGSDFVGYTLDAQVHAWDEASILETASLHPLTARQASRLAGGLPVAIDPVGFGAPRDGRPPGAGDPRVRGDLGGLWTLASLAALTGSPVRHATYHATRGPAGVLPERDGAAAAPAWSILRACGEFRASRWRGIETDAPGPALPGLALCDGPRCRILLGNPAPEARTVRIAGFRPADRAGARLVVPAHGLVRLDGTLS